MGGTADHVHMELTAAVIAALSTTVWTKVGVLPNCLALLCFNDLDKGFSIYFSNKQGESAPANSEAPAYKFAAGEPLFVNYKSIGHIFNECDVYVKKHSSDPTTGSFRLTGIKVAPRKFRG